MTEWRRGSRSGDLGATCTLVSDPGAQRFAVTDRVEAVPLESLADPGALFPEE